MGGGGGGVLAKYGHARILANADIYGQSLTEIKRHQNEKNTLRDYGSIYGHRNLNEAERIENL